MKKNDSGRSSWENTIAAISTAQGVGGIGVIRVSGRDALAIGDRVFQSAGGKKLSQMKGYTAAYGRIRSNGEDIDEAVALVFRAPHSYTGEDVVEFSCHGGAVSDPPGAAGCAGRGSLSRWAGRIYPAGLS